MSDLIRRKQAIQRMIEETEASKKNAIHINEIKRLLQDVDTIETVPVVHGRIIYRIDVPHCSACGKVIHGESNYCRHCGAKLDLPECGARMKGKAE